VKVRLRSALPTAVLAALLWCWGCAQAQPLFHAQAVETADGSSAMSVLVRQALVPPLRYRVVYIPGSGCSGLSAVADRMFRGLLHGQILVLQKPGVQLDAGPAPSHCSDAFVQADDMRTWLTQAKAGLQTLESVPPLPLLMVGVSEGAELLPFLAASLPDVAALLMISGTGLDPLEAGAMQAARLGETRQWQALARAQASSLPDEHLHDGRTLRYWRSLWDWHSEAALMALPMPLMQVWGDADALLPPRAYERFAERAQRRAGGYCRLRFVGADHGLQAAGVDGLQKVWAIVERWGRQPAAGICASLSAATEG